ncbi:MAG TPA: GNAT family N-acetyltransferase [Xanthobacteraceae bacterium]|jgi:ribosomal-protein-alanine N-acetyltransferase
MMSNLAWLFGRREPAVSDASPADAAAIATLHAASFHRGWSEEEIEHLLIDRNVVAHRALNGRRLAGFILSRLVAGEAEILSIAVAARERGHGLARRMLDVHLRALARLGIHAVFLEVGEDNEPARRLYDRAGFRQVGRRNAYYQDRLGRGTAALVLRCDL